jgi:hypothetical protein
MSARKYITPPNLLAQALDLAGPQAAERAIEQAQENLSGMTDECRSRIKGLLREIDDIATIAQDGEFRVTLLSTYTLAVKVVGLGTPAGFPEMDIAAKSLCDVLDGLMVADRPDPRFQTLVMVHTNTMRQLSDPARLGEAAAALLMGLSALRSRFAVRPDAKHAIKT